MNNTVVTYYAEIPNFNSSTNNENLLELWKKNWKSKGWNVVVLNEEYAKSHKDLEQLDVYNETSFLVCNSRLPKKYLWNCYLRWFAYSKYVEETGTIIWSDFDVMNCNLTPEQLACKNIDVDTAFNGSLCSGILSFEGAKNLINNIKLLHQKDDQMVAKINKFLTTVLDKDVNDMIVLMALNTFKIKAICTCLMILKEIGQHCIPFDNEGNYKQEAFPLIHFHHGLFTNPNFLNFPEITSKDRTDIVEYFFKHYLNQPIF